MERFREYLNEGTVPMSMTKKFYEEMGFLEVDTVDEHSSTGKKAFVKAMGKATKKGARRVAMLDPQAVEYALSKWGALSNSIDIWREGNNRALIKQAEKIKTELTQV